MTPKKSSSSTSLDRLSKSEKAIIRPPVLAGCVGKGWVGGRACGSQLLQFGHGLCVGLVKHWFLVGTALGIVGAKVWPWLGSDFGPLLPQFTVKYGAVVSIFFISGVTMKTEAMVATVKDWRQHLFIQGFSLCAAPLLVRFMLVPFLRSSWVGLPEPLVQGFMVGCCGGGCCVVVVLGRGRGGAGCGRKQ